MRNQFRIQRVPTLHTVEGPLYPKNKKYMKKHDDEFRIQRALPIKISVTRGDMSKIRTEKVVFFFFPPKLINIILLFELLFYYFNYYVIIFLRRPILDPKIPLMTWISRKGVKQCR